MRRLGVAALSLLILVSPARAGVSWIPCFDSCGPGWRGAVPSERLASMPSRHRHRRNIHDSTWTPEPHRRRPPWMEAGDPEIRARHRDRANPVTPPLQVRPAAAVGPARAETSSAAEPTKAQPAASRDVPVAPLE